MLSSRFLLAQVQRQRDQAHDDGKDGDGQYIVVAQKIIEHQQGIDHRVNNKGIKHKISLLLGAGSPYSGQLLETLLLLYWWGNGPQLPARVAIISD